MNARGIPTAAVASTGVGGRGGYPSWGGTPCLDLGWGTPPQPAGWGTPPHLELDGVPPPASWMGYPPPPAWSWMGYPPPTWSWTGYPPPCEQTNKVKILPPLVLRTRSVINSHSQNKILSLMIMFGHQRFRNFPFTSMSLSGRCKGSFTLRICVYKILRFTAGGKRRKTKFGRERRTIVPFLPPHIPSQISWKCY